MKKFTLISAALLTTVSLVGCNGDDEGLGNNNNLGVEPTRYNENLDIAPNRDRIEMNDGEFGPNYNDPDYRNMTNRNNGDINNNGFNPNNSDGNNNNGDLNNDLEYDLADDIAERIAKQIDEVDRAYVFVGPENAYVAIVLNKTRDEDAPLSSDLKNRIRQAVKAEDQNIDDVFISANPDFVKQAGDYADELEAGDPVEGFFDEMGDMFRRVFPND